MPLGAVDEVYMFSTRVNCVGVDGYSTRLLVCKEQVVFLGLIWGGGRYQ